MPDRRDGSDRHLPRHVPRGWRADAGRYEPEDEWQQGGQGLQWGQGEPGEFARSAPGRHRFEASRRDRWRRGFQRTEQFGNEGPYQRFDDVERDWWSAGPYSGVGPKGYRRSDERIREEVSELLEQSGQIDAREIEVDAADGIVILRGTVPVRAMKRWAEDAADACAGVRDVRNELRIEPHGQGEARNDDESRAAGTPQHGLTAYMPSESPGLNRSTQTNAATGTTAANRATRSGPWGRSRSTAETR